MLLVWLTKPHKGIFSLLHLLFELPQLFLLLKAFLLILLRYMSENKLKNYTQHSDFLWKLIKLLTQYFTCCLVKQHIPLSCHESHRSIRTVNLINSLSERSHQFLQGFKKTRSFVSDMYISNTKSYGYYCIAKGCSTTTKEPKWKICDML